MSVLKADGIDASLSERSYQLVPMPCSHVARVFWAIMTCAVLAAAVLPAAPLPTKKSSDKIPSRPASVAGSHTGSHSGSEAV
jgi:hypothetical protein